MLGVNSPCNDTQALGRRVRNLPLHMIGCVSTGVIGKVTSQICCTYVSYLIKEKKETIYSKAEWSGWGELEKAKAKEKALGVLGEDP